MTARTILYTRSDCLTVQTFLIAINGSLKRPVYKLQEASPPPGFILFRPKYGMSQLHMIPESLPTAFSHTGEVTPILDRTRSPRLIRHDAPAHVSRRTGRFPVRTHSRINAVRKSGREQFAGKVHTGENDAFATPPPAEGEELPPIHCSV